MPRELTPKNSTLDKLRQILLDRYDSSSTSQNFDFCVARNKKASIEVLKKVTASTISKKIQSYIDDKKPNAEILASEFQLPLKLFNIIEENWEEMSAELRPVYNGIVNSMDEDTVIETLIN